VHKALYCPRCAAPLEDRVPELDSRLRKVCTACGFILYVNPKMSAGSVPVLDGKLALIRRALEPGRGLWSFPCGWVEADETVEECARRETLEECGLHIELGDLLGIYSYPAGSPLGPAVGAGIIVISFAARAASAELVPGDDADDAAWFAPDDIPWDELAFDSSHRALRAMLARGVPAVPRVD
jgi:ADP-ribose pyrophosphatase YjhB (NUDIX family)